jgi:predicted dehydrogenase
LKVKVAVIEAGYISRQHLGCLQQLPVADTVGVCGPASAMAESVGEKFGARWLTEHRQMLEELRPDVVHVGMPPRTHYALCRGALESGTTGETA